MIKKIIHSLFVCMAGFIFINAINKTSGGHPSSTGAPDEKSCSRPDCHSDASITYDSPVNTFSFSDPASTYNLNGYYNLSVEVNLKDILKFGFEIVAIDSATKKNVGKWIISESNRTHIINGEAPFTTRKYITHTTNGTVPIAAGKNKWNFKWQAPSTNVGTIFFYYATNATNKNDAATGDQLFLSNHKIRFSTSSVSVIKPEIIKPSLKINGNTLIVSAENQTIQSLTIYNLEGKMVYQNVSLKNGEIINIEELNLLGNSIFVYQLVTDKGSYRGKVRV